MHKPGAFLGSQEFEWGQSFFFREAGTCKIIGQASLMPITVQREESWYLSTLLVVEKYRGKGFGRRLLEETRLFLEDAGTPAVLENDLYPRDKAYGIYLRNGWKRIEKYPNWRSFNSPSEDFSILAVAESIKLRERVVA